MPASYLQIGGNLIRDAVLTSVTVSNQLNRHSWCEVRCRQTEDRRLPVENYIGQPFQVITYAENGATNIAFDGFVLKAGLDYEVYGSFAARITSVTRSYKLGLAPHEACYRKSTLASIAPQLARAAGLSAAVRCPALPARNYVQWGETDFCFLRRLADDHEAWLRPTPEGIEISTSFSDGPTLPWREEDGLYSFRVSGRLGPASFGGTHYDARQMRSTTLWKVAKAPGYTGASAPLVDAFGRAAATALPAGTVQEDHRAATGEEFRDFLEHEAVRSLAGGVVAEGVSRNEAVRAGDTVRIQGPLDAAGVYGVFRVVHHWTPRGYSNRFWCTPGTTWLEGVRPEAPRLGGVVPARVTAHNDPRKMGRIQVQYDWQDSGQTAWARMLTPHAGGDRGFHFLPEIGDEVLVAFEDGRPERPYILGALWNGVDQAPRQEFWGEDVAPNDVKRIVTKSGHRIQLSDKRGKESIVLATPAALKVSLLENAEETSRPMLLLHSAGDIFFSAPAGRIHFRSAAFSREVGTSGQATAPAPAARSAPRPDYAAQAASLRLAAATGTALCGT